MDRATMMKAWAHLRASRRRSAAERSDPTCTSGSAPELTEADVSTPDGGGSLLDRQARAAASPDDFFDGIVDERLVESIDALSEDFREPLILSDLADLNYAEIAEVLDIPVGTVKSRLFRARRQLRNALIAQGLDSAYAGSRPRPDRGHHDAV